MKRRRDPLEQIIGKLREAERLLGEGKTIPEAAKTLEISEQSSPSWRVQYGGTRVDDAKRLTELERENRQLRVTVADQALENRASTR
jgi:putative transposase